MNVAKLVSQWKARRVASSPSSLNHQLLIFFCVWTTVCAQFRGKFSFLCHVRLRFIRNLGAELEYESDMKGMLGTFWDIAVNSITGPPREMYLF